MPKVAVIVLSYNLLEETTKPCLESIFNAKSDCDFEVVAVDNASSDGTREHLQALKNSHPNLKLILNTENKGFAGGNNMGIRAAEADFYVLLNNDTRVSDYWLDKMLAFAAAHPEIGLTGPISNTVGNEQVVYLPAEDPQSVMQSGRGYASRHEDSWFYTTTLGFFCVMIRNEVFRKIGLLDENFGLGFFEDDDFCLRASSQGFKLACMESVFIFHQGSVSFRNLDSSPIFRRNRRYYEKKHGCKWRTSFRIGVFLDLLDSIVVQIAPDRLEQSQQRIANRLKVMRAFDLECFDHPVQADFDNDSLESIQSKNLQLQLCRQEKQNLRDELEEQCRELEEQCRNFAQLKTEYEELLGRLDWRLLMKINRLPGVAAIKRLLRPLVSRILKL
ncbi:MAG: glycosyltransferase [Thermoguttaceae bacterium]|jgi:GT2 family glycosyltransferase